MRAVIRTFLIAAVALCAIIPATKAQDPSDPVAFATTYLQTLDKGDLVGAFQRFWAPEMQAQTSLEDFQTKFLGARVSVGQPRGRYDLVKREPVDVQPVPAQGAVPPGTYVQVRFRSYFPETVATEDVYLRGTPDGDWKVVGTWIKPAAF